MARKKPWYMQIPGGLWSALGGAGLIGLILTQQGVIANKNSEIRDLEKGVDALVRERDATQTDVERLASEISALRSRQEIFELFGDTFDRYMSFRLLQGSGFGIPIGNCGPTYCYMVRLIQYMSDKADSVRFYLSPPQNRVYHLDSTGKKVTPEEADRISSGDYDVIRALQMIVPGPPWLIEGGHFVDIPLRKGCRVTVVGDLAEFVFVIENDSIHSLRAGMVVRSKNEDIDWAMHPAPEKAELLRIGEPQCPR